MPTLTELRDAAHANSIAKGFHDRPQSVGDACALMHSELSELLEDARDGADPHVVWYEEKVAAYDMNGARIYVDGRPAMIAVRHTMNPAGDLKPCGIPSEVADLIIRALDFCGKHGIDVEGAIREKMLYNATRPAMHGGKKF